MATAYVEIPLSGQNNFNMRSNAGSTSLFKGVYRYKDHWAAKIQKDRKGIWLGCFDIEEDAARAYDAKARELFGAYAALNFAE